MRDDFSNQVFNKIKEIGVFIVDKNLKKIGYKKIADQKGNALGYIDVLYIIPNRRLIVLVKVKILIFHRALMK